MSIPTPLPNVYVRGAVFDGVTLDLSSYQKIKLSASVTSNDSVTNKLYVDAKVSEQTARIDAILAGSSLNLDSLKEISDYIASLDSTNQGNLIQSLADLNAALSSEASTARAAENALTLALDAEAVTARAAEGAEFTRATDAELVLTNALEAEASTARAAESALTSALSSEASTARAAESALTSALAAEASTARAAEAAEQSARVSAFYSLKNKVDMLFNNFFQLPSDTAQIYTDGFGIKSIYFPPAFVPGGMSGMSGMSGMYVPGGMSGMSGMYVPGGMSGMTGGAPYVPPAGTGATGQ